MHTTDLLARVKSATRTQHERLEGLMPFDERLTMSTYQDVLRRFLGLFEPLESALQKQPLPSALNFPTRMRQGSLINDLLTVGVAADDIRSIPRCHDFNSLRNLPYAIGCMYVVEGSRLGGQHISRLVRERLGIGESGCEFFSSHGVEVGVMWRSFCDIVRSLVIEPLDQNDFIEGATFSFSIFSLWMEASDDGGAGKQYLTTRTS